MSRDFPSPSSSAIGGVLSGSMGDLAPSPEKALLELAKGSLSDSVGELYRRSRGLPTEEDFHFYANFQEFKRPVAEIQSSVAAMLSQLGSLGDVFFSPSGFRADVDEGYDWLVGLQDALLEKVDASLDKFYLEKKAEFKGNPRLNAVEASLRKTALVSIVSNSVPSEVTSKTGDVKVKRKEKAVMRSPVPFHIPTIPRPQDTFDCAVDNSNTPFRHEFRLGLGFPNYSGAITSQEIGQASEILEENVREVGDGDSPENVHPLAENLNRMSYVEDLTDSVGVRKYSSLEDTPFTLVTSLKALKEMAVKLRAAGEIAIDLENHHYRSYQGFVCLMQVSTLDEDFIVDTLNLRSEIGSCLRDIFADPSIRKVMHGADRDIVWLQRDFGIYVCNLFDTGQAARVLQLEGFGLAFLLEYFCKVHADKRYQLADWRIRPLPSEMVKYAREDTHYLLYVYDMLRQLLLDARVGRKAEEEDPFLEVYKRSRDICLQLYAKERFTQTSYQHLPGLQEKKLRPDQLAVLAALYSWRDSLARKEDESTGFLLPNYLLLQLASEMPEDLSKLLTFAKGSNSFLSRNANAVLEIIRQAKDEARNPSESHSKRDEGELVEESRSEDPKTKKEVSKMGPPVHIKETLVKVATRSPFGQEGRIKTVQIDNPIEESTVVGTSGLDSSALQATGSHKAGDLVSNTVPGEGPSKLTSLPVCVFRSKLSSFFGGKPEKILNTSPPSVNVPVPKKLCAMSYSQDSLTEVSNLPTSSYHNTDQGLSDTSTGEHCERSLKERQGLDPVEERLVSEERALISETVVTSMEIDTAGAVSAESDEAIDRASDIPAVAPEVSPLEMSLREGKSFQTNTSATLVDNSTSAAFVLSVKFSGNATITQAKAKPSKLGAFFGGCRKVQQIGSFDLSKEAERARMMTLEIESSMVLPFGRPVKRLQDVPRMNTKHLTREDVNVITMQEEQLDDCNRSLHEETAGQTYVGISEKAVCSTGSAWEDVIMLETEHYETRQRVESDNTVVGKDSKKSKKHRAWWFPVADIISGRVPHRDSSSSHAQSLDARSNQQLDKVDGSRGPEVPVSLSEIHSNFRRGKKSRRSSDISFDQVDLEGPRGSGSKSKKGRKYQSLVAEVETEDSTEVSTGKKVDFTRFNYREVKDSFSLDNVYTKKAEERGGSSSSRGNRKGSSRQGIPLSKTAFDPLRRSRLEPKPDGIQPGRRRQVFPQSGNRTAVFKK